MAKCFEFLTSTLLVSFKDCGLKHLTKWGNSWFIGFWVISCFKSSTGRISQGEKLHWCYGKHQERQVFVIEEGTVNCDYCPKSGSNKVCPINSDFWLLLVQIFRIPLRKLMKLHFSHLIVNLEKWPKSPGYTTEYIEYLNSWWHQRRHCHRASWGSGVRCLTRGLIEIITRTAISVNWPLGAFITQISLKCHTKSK